MTNLTNLLREEVRDYATSAFKGKLYFSVSEDETFYSVTFVPDADYPAKVEIDIVIAACIIDNIILVEKDSTDKPLYKELLRRGIPREQIILRYAGEKTPD